MAVVTEELIRRVIQYTLDMGFRYSDDRNLSDISDEARWARWNWNMGVALHGVWRAAEALGDRSYTARIKEWIDARTGNLPKICVNTVAPMLTVLRLDRIGPDERYEALYRIFDPYIMRGALRVPCGAIAHTTLNSDHPEAIWADTVYMTVIYLIRRGETIGNGEYVEEGLRQLVWHLEKLHDPSTGLFYHGWDDVASQPLGVLWGRGNAWLTDGIIEILDGLRADFPQKSRVLEMLHAQLAAFQRFQEPDGFWHTVVDHPERYKETSVTAGVAAGALHGIRLGLVDAKYREMALKAVAAVASRVDADGAVQGGSSGTPTMAKPENYQAIPFKVTPFNQGLTLLALSEGYRVEK